MQFSGIEVNSGVQQTKKHGSHDFPFAIYTYNFNSLRDGYNRWHWHKEIQFSFSLFNKVIFIIDNQQIILEPGEGIMINTNVMHKIKPYEDYCFMFTVVFDSILIGGEQHSIIEKKYVKPILENTNFRFIYLSPIINWQENILISIKEIFILYYQEDYGYELRIRNCLGNIWSNLVSEMIEKNNDYASVISYDDERIKLALEYIHKNYAENITLDNIAMSANISKSECCRCFKRVLKLTPFQYLIEYRISKASELILKTNKSISNIALDVGFNGISYFGKMFRKYQNCTPFEYRHKYLKCK